MVESTLNEQYERDGFIHVRGVLSFDEVVGLREHLDYLFELREAAGDSFDPFTIFPSEFIHDEKLWRTLFAEKVTEALKQILEPSYAMIPDFLASKNLFRLTGEGWHWDSSSEGKRAYLHNQDYRFVKCGIYLQENTKEFGGGVDIAPGFHKWPLKCRNTNLNFKFKNLADLIGKKFFARTVDLLPGDFLAFSSCVPHRTTRPQTLIEQATPEERKLNRLLHVPKDKTKYVIYWDSCRLRWSNGYITNNARRAREDELSKPDCSFFFHSDSSSLAFPGDYPQEFADALTATGLRLEGSPLTEASAIKRSLEVKLNDLGINLYIV